MSGRLLRGNNDKKLSTPTECGPLAAVRRIGNDVNNTCRGLAFSGYQEKIAINLLVRAKSTTSQTGLSGVERRRNLKDAFRVTNQKSIEGKSVWLVDDVFTTGTTVSECSKTLKKRLKR